MLTVNLKTRTLDDWAGKFADDTMYDVLYDEDVTVYKPDGSILLVLKKKSIPKEIISEAWSVLKGYNATTNNRGVATGSGYVRQVKQDGTVSKTNRTPPEGVVKSGIIGYFERSVRFPYCRACAWNLQFPDKWTRVLPLFQYVSRLFEIEVPERFAVQKAIVDKTSKDFVIPGTVYTTITVNKNFRTACHKDAGDLPEGFSAMAVIREGKFRGGNLVLPEYRVAVALDTADVIFFDPHEFHGNTKIIPLSKDFTRCSLVHYYRQGMTNCRGAEEELQRVKYRQKGEALTD